MSKTSVKFISLATLALLAASAAPQVASATATQHYGTQGSATFKEGTGTGVKPVDPQKPVDPVTPKEPDGVTPPGTLDPVGPLTIVYASSFDFGENEVSNVAKTYPAAAQKIENDTKTRTNFVQVVDNRGTFGGWNLKVTMSDFKTTDAALVAMKKDTLAGAKITLGDAEIQDEGTSNPADKFAATTELSPGVQSGTILGASAGHGSGNNLIDFGGKKGDTKNTAVKLFVPAGAAGAVKYTANLTWVLDDTPAN